MDPLRVLTQDCGFFTRQEAESAGYDDRAIALMVRSRVWTRFRRGFYAFTDEWRVLDDVGRHLVRCRAVLRSMGDAVVLSHVSAAVAHGIDVWGISLERVHVTRMDGGAGRIERDVVHHEGACPDADLTVVDGMPVTTAVRCVIEAGSQASSEAALCLFDSGLYRRLFDQDALMRRHLQLGDWPGMQHLHVPVRMATPDAQSVGETRGRWLFRTHHLPAPICQFKVYGPDGEVIGTCDWGWPEHELLAEFDGEVKYGRLLRPGQDPGEVVFAEKVREDRLREASGHRMMRLTWSDYERPAQVIARAHRLLRRAA